MGGAVAPFVILPIMINAGPVAADITMIVLLIIAAILIRLGRAGQGSVAPRDQQTRGSPGP